MLHEPHPLRPYRQIAERVLALCTTEGLAPGDRLPAERDLADRFGVSRPSLREALIALEVEGRLEIRMGSGIYLTAGGIPQTRLDEESPFEILDARAVVESAIAEEAAHHASAAQIARLDRNLRKMEAAFDDRPLAIRLDGEFHIAVAHASGNALLQAMTADIFQKRLRPFFTRLAGHIEGPPTWRLACAEHLAIRDAIAAHDGDAARRAMRHHLTQSQMRLSASFAEAP